MLGGLEIRGNQHLPPVEVLLSHSWVEVLPCLPLEWEGKTTGEEWQVEGGVASGHLNSHNLKNQEYMHFLDLETTIQSEGSQRENKY